MRRRKLTRGVCWGSHSQTTKSIPALNEIPASSNFSIQSNPGMIQSAMHQPTTRELMQCNAQGPGPPHC
ncbi:hypothetical protein BJ165DRAFT_1509330 [Panaeolus papilionaceus]|nr:hypothetical protein BJ165DRAFT_1509330 [Panaeolus papilionaceus]